MIIKLIYPVNTYLFCTDFPLIFYTQFFNYERRYLKTYRNSPDEILYFTTYTCSFVFACDLVLEFHT